MSCDNANITLLFLIWNISKLFLRFFLFDKKLSPVLHCGTVYAFVQKTSS